MFLPAEILGDIIEPSVLQILLRHLPRREYFPDILFYLPMGKCVSASEMDQSDHRRHHDNRNHHQ